VALALEDYKPFADEGAESGGGESKTVVWVSNACAGISKQTHAPAQLQCLLRVHANFDVCVYEHINVKVF